MGSDNLEDELAPKTVDIFYDAYFRGVKGHDYTDEEITWAVVKEDVDDCLRLMKEALYHHFGIDEKGD